MTIYEAQFEILGMLMHKGIHVDVHWLIDAKVRLAGEFSDSFIAYMSGLEKGFISPLAQRILVTVSTAHQLIEQLEAFVPQYDREASQLDWSIDKSSKRCKLD
ncbi:hypothetical protein QYF36_018817 [Acer negundo]|nr:hypothetical protein QYF36_018817 [Acer negundo]